MPAPPRENTFDAGVNGATVLASDPGSPDSFDAVAGAPTYTNVQAHSSPLAMRWVGVTDDQQGIFTGLGSITTDVWTRFYLFLPSLPADNNYYPLGFRTSANAASAFLRILSTGIIQMRNAGNAQIGSSGSVAVATNQWVRIEARCVSSTTVGQLEWWLYNSPEAAVGSFSDHQAATGAVLGANTDRAAYGTNITGVVAGITHYFDDVKVATTGQIGPSVTSRYRTMMVGSRKPLVACKAHQALRRWRYGRHGILVPDLAWA